MDKRSRFINFVIDDLVNNTFIDNNGYIVFPFSINTLSLPLLIDDSLYPSLPILFSKYSKERYGLTKDEIDYVWGQFKTIIIDRISNKDNINESIEDKKSRFINFVINDLVSDTIIDYDKDSIYFYVNDMPLPLSIFYTHLTKQYSKFLYRPLPSFSDNCKERYGLTEDEIDYVWDQYKIIIKDKITNK